MIFDNEGFDYQHFKTQIETKIFDHQNFDLVSIKRNGCIHFYPGDESFSSPG